MMHAKLCVLGQERDLLWCETDYYREVKVNGKPSTEVIGGLLTICYISHLGDDLFLRWITKDTEDESGKEIDKMEEGEVQFYENGYDSPPSKTWKFNDSLLVSYREDFSADGNAPMQVILTISPAIQNYGTEFIQYWNENNVRPDDFEQGSSEENTSKILDCYYTDLEGNKNVKLSIGDEFYVVLSTENMVGDMIDLELGDDQKDFIYKGKRLENDTLKDYKVTSSEERIKMTIAGPHPELIDL